MLELSCFTQRVAKQATVLRDLEFPKEFKKMVADDAEIVMPDMMAKEIKELPHAPEVVELMKKIAGPNHPCVVKPARFIPIAPALKSRLSLVSNTPLGNPFKVKNLH